MGKMEDTYIFKYLQLLLYCWAGFGLPMRPSPGAWTGCCAPAQAGIKQPLPHRVKKGRTTSKTSGCVMISNQTSVLAEMGVGSVALGGPGDLAGPLSPLGPCWVWLLARCRFQPGPTTAAHGTRAGCWAEKLPSKGHKSPAPHPLTSVPASCLF